MINKYYDFLLESHIIKMIKESEMKASSEFLDKLKQIKKNKIAKIVFDIFDEEYQSDEDMPHNWIDITEEDDMISFISDKKADVSMDKDEFSPFIMKGRSSIKIGRFVRSLFKNTIVDSDEDINFKDKDYEEFVNLYKSTSISKSKKFKLVKGDDISDWYNESKYSSGNGTLGSSCMKDVDDRFFDIYSKNDSCQLLIYIDDNKKLLGRALVWKLKDSPCKAEYFMDRVYANNDSDIIKFKNYAVENGWLYKYSMSSDAEMALLFYYGDKSIFGRISVQLKKSDFRNYPFVDTLNFLDRKSKLLSNVGFKDGISLGSTYGGYDTCYLCRGKGVEVCDACDNEPVFDECKSCQGKGCKSCKKGMVEVSCVYCKGKEILCSECTGLEKVVKDGIKKGNFKGFKL